MWIEREQGAASHGVACGTRDERLRRRARPVCGASRRKWCVRRAAARDSSGGARPARRVRRRKWRARAEQSVAGGASSERPAARGASSFRRRHHAGQFAASGVSSERPAASGSVRAQGEQPVARGAPGELRGERLRQCAGRAAGAAGGERGAEEEHRREANAVEECWEAAPAVKASERRPSPAPGASAAARAWALSSWCA